MARGNWSIVIVLLAVTSMLLTACGGSEPTATPVPPMDTPVPPTDTPLALVSAAGDMVFVPAGEFIMGSPVGQGETDEHPQHTVYLNAFSIDKTEVTVAQYQRCVEVGACSAPDIGGSCNYGVLGWADYPINCVDWNQAVTFCRWAGKRLPTEAEWEKAARGTDGRVYPWGNAWDAGKMYSWDGYPHTTIAVGSYPDGASPYGALDMAGNVGEWVADWYNANYYGQSPHENPIGRPGSRAERVVRGGSFHDDASGARAARRFRPSPDYRTVVIGFRCAHSP